MKLLIAFSLLTVCLTATGQTSPATKGKSQYLDTDSTYTDSAGITITIQNSLPKGGLRYIHPSGKDFGYVIFWTRVINETESPVELTINFPADSFAVLSQPGTWFKLFLPPDTMTLDKVSLYDYGATGLKSFLDSGFNKPTMLQRIINPEEECFFYVAALYNRGVDGVVRAALVLKEQDLFYRITGIEIPCGHIVVKKIKR
jgi:hypothetical protein